MEDNVNNNMMNILRGLVTGLFVGLVVTFFANSVAFATRTAKNLPYLVLLLPVGALVTEFLFSRFGEDYKKVTTIAIDRIHDTEDNLAKAQNKRISPMMGIICYVNSMISHFLGAAVGKEGVGVQMGLSLSMVFEGLEERFTRKDNSSYYLMCGASAAFSTLFSSPIAGTLFGANFASPRLSRLDAYLPCLVSSYTARLVSTAVGIHIISIPAYDELPFTLNNILIMAVLSFILGMLTRITVFLIDFFKEDMGLKISRNPYLRHLVPAVGLSLLSILVYFLLGTFDYNGLSSELIGESIMGERGFRDFILKAVFILLSMSAGFQGGEVVPLLVLGALFGSSVSILLGLPVAPVAALCSIAMLSGGTNLPLVCFALGMELFGYGEPAMLFLCCTIAFISSGRRAIYSHQRT